MKTIAEHECISCNKELKDGEIWEYDCGHDIRDCEENKDVEE
jgi:hypothetical protein